MTRILEMEEKNIEGEKHNLIYAVVQNVLGKVRGKINTTKNFQSRYQHFLTVTQLKRNKTNHKRF